MTGNIVERDGAVEAAREYAAGECVGQFGEVLDVERDGDDWSVRFRTHTYGDEYCHRVRINRVGNVFSHEREDSAVSE